ncbi:MAG: MBL fold metallo-hydrolase [Acidimicrobiaceae bacterium]|nr:MBL fold metallo-hydrolase [Acidimicrobiaceae bacterium]
MEELWTGESRVLTDAVSVLVGAEGGKYPSGNSLVIRGAGESVIVDPSVSVVAQGGLSVRVDAVLNSHGHEDHIAGNKMFPDARVHVHHEDLPALRSLEGMLEVQGPTPQEREALARLFVDEFFYSPRPDAHGFSDGDVFDLGGVTVEAVHLPGHTRGHSGFRISGGVFFLSDIDLSGFGPYYGDAWSDLDQFELSIRQVRDEEADFYVTFHHKGVIDSREEFLKLLDAFEAAIPRRHQAMLEFLSEPRTIADMVQHRFIYRPDVQSVFVDRVEARSAELHLDRMRRHGEIEDLPDGRVKATTA